MTESNGRTNLAITLSVSVDDNTTHVIVNTTNIVRWNVARTNNIQTNGVRTNVDRIDVDRRNDI